MSIREFLYTHKYITYFILSSYLLMSINQSYAMNESQYELVSGNISEDVSTTKAKNLQIINPNLLLEFDKTPPITPSSPNDNSIFTFECASVPQDPPHSKTQTFRCITQDEIIHYLKFGASALTSLSAASGLGVLAFNLAGSNPALAWSLGIDGLLANALLYHKNNMGLSINDLNVDLSGSKLQNAQTCGYVSLKLSIAAISSIPLYYVTEVALQEISPIFADIASIASFLCTLPLYHKAQTACVDYVRYILELMSIKGEMKEHVWFYQNRLEETAILDRDEIHALYDEFSKIKAKKSESDVFDNEFRDLMLRIMPAESDATNRFWFKESTGTAFAGFAAIFGGMYLFMISDPIYVAFLQTNTHTLSPAKIIALALFGALSISIGQNALQTKSSYDVGKNGGRLLSRTYDTRINKINSLLIDPCIESGLPKPTKRNISQVDRTTEYLLDARNFVLAAGVAATRAAICIIYMENNPLLTPVLTGTSIAFFATFYRAIQTYFESLTDTGKKRTEISTAIQAKIKAIIKEYKSKDPSKNHAAVST